MRTSIRLLTAVLLLAACRREQDTAESRAELCNSLAKLQASAATLMNPPPNATIGDLRKAREAVKKDVEEVREEAQQLHEARLAAVAKAHDDLVDALNAVPNDATLSEAAAQVAPQALAFRAAVEQASSTVQCPATGTVPNQSP